MQFKWRRDKITKSCIRQSQPQSSLGTHHNRGTTTVIPGFPKEYNKINQKAINWKLRLNAFTGILSSLFLIRQDSHFFIYNWSLNNHDSSKCYNSHSCFSPPIVWNIGNGIFLSINLKLFCSAQNLLWIPYILGYNPWLMKPFMCGSPYFSCVRSCHFSPHISCPSHVCATLSYHRATLRHCLFLLLKHSFPFVLSLSTHIHLSHGTNPYSFFTSQFKCHALPESFISLPMFSHTPTCPW